MSIVMANIYKNKIKGETLLGNKLWIFKIKMSLKNYQKSIAIKLI